jgi:hypothetical protein
MIEKEAVLSSLEKERQFAIEINEPVMALGIAQAIQVIRNMGVEQ